jgi:hypothetical protein
VEAKIGAALALVIALPQADPKAELIGPKSAPVVGIDL